MSRCMQDILLEEADMLVNPIEEYDFVTESLIKIYGIKDDEVETNPKKAVTTINRMKIRRDIKAILRIIEIALLAVIAYRVSAYILGIIFTAGVAAIIWVLYQLSTKVVGPAIYGTKSFFVRYITVVNTKAEEEDDPKKVENLKELNKRLNDGLTKIEKAEDELSKR